MPTAEKEQVALTRVEFVVKIKGDQCVDKVKSSLINDAKVDKKQIESVIDSGEARIVIATNRPWIELHEIIERTGYEAALVGFSDQSAVSILDKGNATNIKGVVRFCSAPQSGLVIDGVIDGLKELTSHAFTIHEYGDVSDGCRNLGEIYKNSSFTVASNDVGRAVLRTTTADNHLTIPELLGRGVCISSESGERLACGVVCRSAGIFQNFKRICVCSGKILWDERDLQNVVKK